MRARVSDIHPSSFKAAKTLTKRSKRCVSKELDDASHRGGRSADVAQIEFSAVWKGKAGRVYSRGFLLSIIKLHGEAALI